MVTSPGTALVVGADGYLGRHLAQHLLGAGWRVLATVMPGTPDSVTPRGAIEVRELDLRGSGWHGILDGWEADVSFCLAWPGVAPAARGDLELQRHGIDIALASVEASALCGARVVVMPGSTAEHGWAEGPIDGNTPPSPISAYGAAKVAARWLCSERAHELGIDFRYALLAGTYSEDRLDGNVIAHVAQSLLRGTSPALTECKQLWDYVHVDDAVAALEAIALFGSPGRAYGVSHGDGWRLRRYVELVRDAVGEDIPLGYGQVPYLCGRLPEGRVSIHGLVHDTDFLPSVDFAEGAGRMVAALRRAGV